MRKQLKAGFVGTEVIGPKHQFICRLTGRVMDERLPGDPFVLGLYNVARERVRWLFDAVTSPRFSTILGFWLYDRPFVNRTAAVKRMAGKMGVDLMECVDPPEAFRCARAFFERKIRYWQCRPLSEEPGEVVSPADSLVLPGSLVETSMLRVKEAFFSFEELIGEDKTLWHKAFNNGDFAVFRLTPDKYHYNHFPVSGRVLEIYPIEGRFHSCNPGAVIAEGTPFSKNRRVVTILDTDVSGGTGVGLVAMVEVAALMIGEIVQCCSDEQYLRPSPAGPGRFVRKGNPKSLFRPGSSSVVLLFQETRIRFCRDLVENSLRADVFSRYSLGFGRPLVETSVRVREKIAESSAFRSDSIPECSPWK